MLRTLMAASLISLVIGCAQKDAGKGLVKLPGRNSAPDFGSAGPEKAPSLDSTFYIGYVDYFPETKEFYTALFYKEGHDHPDEDLLQSKLDSVINYDEDWGRERLPLSEAKEFLLLSGLDTLSIYNRKHEAICQCPLTRVEYLWNGLESYFIAVYKSDGNFPGQTEELYGLSQDFPSQNLSMLSAHEVTDSKLNEELVNRLGLSKASSWDMRHYRIQPPGAHFSIISTYSMETNDSESYLTVSEKDRTLILNEETDNFHYLNILPVPVQMNGKPLLLITAGYPSSDVIWDYLAGFDGLRYEALDFNRVHLKDMSPQWSPVLSQASGK